MAQSKFLIKGTFWNVCILMHLLHVLSCHADERTQGRRPGCCAGAGSRRACTEALLPGQGGKVRFRGKRSAGPGGHVLMAACARILLQKRLKKLVVLDVPAWVLNGRGHDWAQ